MNGWPTDSGVIAIRKLLRLTRTHLITHSFRCGKYGIKKLFLNVDKSYSRHTTSVNQQKRKCE